MKQQQIVDGVIWVDGDDKELGIVSRERAHKEGLLHRIAMVYVSNEKGEILVQQRLSGRYDHSSAGHVDPGETYEQAAYRELVEELGIDDAKLREVGMGVSTDTRPDGRKHNHMYRIFGCVSEPKRVNKVELKGVHWEDPLSVLEKMKRDEGDLLYTAVFKDSLRVYMEVK